MNPSNTTMHYFLAMSAVFFITFFGTPVVLESMHMPNTIFNTKLSHLFIGGIELTVAVADNHMTRVRGLSYLSSLPNNRGLFFVFPKSDTYGIWMEGMRFPIDIIWISNDFTIVDIKQSATPESYPESFYPRSSARYVLEVPAGFSKAHNIGIGQTVVWRSE